VFLNWWTWVITFVGVTFATTIQESGAVGGRGGGVFSFLCGGGEGRGFQVGERRTPPTPAKPVITLSFFCCKALKLYVDPCLDGSFVVEIGYCYDCTERCVTVCVILGKTFSVNEHEMAKTGI